MSKPASWLSSNFVEDRVPQSLVVTGDLHYGITDKRVEAARVAFIRDVKPEAYIDIGDFYDQWAVSSYPKSPERARHTEAQLQFEFDDAQPYIKEVCKYAKWFHLIEGNHDDRLTRAKRREPGLDSLRGMSLKRLAELPEKVKLHAYGTRLHLAGLSFEHGDGVPRGVQNPAKWMLGHRRKSVISGHVHYMSQASMTTYNERGRPEIRMAWTQGAGLDFSKQDYCQDPNWQHGFTYVTFFKVGSDWRFSVCPIVVVDGAFSYGGKVYSGKKWM